MGHLLEVKDVTKIYEGGVLANHNVNFTVDEGEIHALVGENGAGKSTLMKMLYGLEGITSGHIYLNGKELKLQSGKEAIEHGIGMVHQHFMLVDSLTGATCPIGTAWQQAATAPWQITQTGRTCMWWRQRLTFRQTCRPCMKPLIKVLT